jgi:solute carrier family 25 folate transporter 32
MSEDVRDTPTSVPLSFFSGVKYEHLVAGLSGGVVSTLATHPFDLIKLRFAGRIERY